MKTDAESQIGKRPGIPKTPRDYLQICKPGKSLSLVPLQVPSSSSSIPRKAHPCESNLGHLYGSGLEEKDCSTRG
jgi:hypothetical protein